MLKISRCACCCFFFLKNGTERCMVESFTDVNKALFCICPCVFDIFMCEMTYFCYVVRSSLFCRPRTSNDCIRLVFRGGLVF